MKNIVYLLKIAELYDLFSSIETSTIKLSGQWGISQQSVSRILMLLERDNLISRVPSQKGITIKILPKGMNCLRGYYNILKRHYSIKSLIFTGEIVDGLSEGKYYINQPGYRKHYVKSFPD